MSKGRAGANWNTELALCVLLSVLGILRLEMRELWDEHRALTTTVFSQLENGEARATLPLPTSIDPMFGFDIEAPRMSRLFRSAESQSALAPAACSGARCTYHVSGSSPAPLTAVVARPGPYGFEIMQQSNMGEVHAHLALRVRR